MKFTDDEVKVPIFQAGEQIFRRMLFEDQSGSRGANQLIQKTLSCVVWSCCS